MFEQLRSIGKDDDILTITSYSVASRQLP